MRALCRNLMILAAATTIGCGGARTPPATSPPPPAEPVPTEAAGPAGAADGATSPESSTRRVHRVQRGDTLSSLSRRYGVSVADLARANDIADPNRIAVGDRLIVPDPAGGGGTWVSPVPGGEILSAFGSRRGDDIHRGLDIRARAGQEVLAAWSGVVVYAGDNMRDYGTAVILDHGRGLTSLYGHNSRLLVRDGDRVERGQPIALAGQTGNATTVHCHFEVRRNAVALDPVGFLAAPPASGRQSTPRRHR